MRNFVTLSILLTVCVVTLMAQENEFGTAGSYWVYSYENHSGGPPGATMILIEKDTMINGEVHKKIRETRRRQYSFTVPVEWSQFTYTIQIKNDSVFRGGDLIFDLHPAVGDTLRVKASGVISYFVLRYDSVITETIDGEQYSKWYATQYCYDGTNLNPPTISNDPVVFLETVGPIGREYLFWNSDGCTTIGGGTHVLYCYKNGNFSYLETGVSDCEKLQIPSSIIRPKIEQPTFYPNPVKHTLYLHLKQQAIQSISITDMNGKLILEEVVSGGNATVNVEHLLPGMYLLKMKNYAGEVRMARFSKQ